MLADYDAAGYEDANVPCQPTASFLDFISWNAHLSLLSDTALCRFMLQRKQE